MVKGCTKRTIDRYRKQISWTLNRINKTVTEITADDVRYYIALRLTQDRISKVSANNEILCLRTFFAWLNVEEIIPVNPMNKVDRIKADKVKKKAFTDLECEKIRASCRSAMETAIVEVLLSTGCRVSELCGIRIDDIRDGKCIVHGKGNKDRTVYFTAKAELAIQRFLAERSDVNPYLFPGGIPLATSKNHSAYCKPTWYQHPDLIGDNARDKGAVEETVRNIGKRAGVENVHPHRFRRTLATNLAARGMAIQEIQKILGHSNISTTMEYIYVNGDKVKSSYKQYTT
jgi:site-specific recombinase XerD